MAKYLVTAIVQDNREGTMKVCARTEDSFDAAHAILRELAKDEIEPAIGERIVREQWAIHCIHVELDPFDLVNGIIPPQMEG
jgi:hypothetical protein